MLARRADTSPCLPIGVDMTVYFVTGKLGSGKSLVSVGKIRDYMAAGRRVATNLDIWPDELFTNNKATITRLPDKPRVEDMNALGDGYESENPRDNDESRYGLIVLDECGTWLNSREWNDKGRRQLIDWFLHARKKRWDIIFLIQDIEACDGQIVRALGEHVVICRRMDKYRVLKLRLPRFHVASVYYGRPDRANFVERWVYRGSDLFNAYDTRQVFDDGIEFYDKGPVDMRAPYTVLSAWHLKGRYVKPAAESKPWTISRALGLLLWPVFAIWVLVDLDSFERVALRRHERLVLERRRIRQETLRDALDPNIYPKLPANLEA